MKEEQIAKEKAEAERIREEMAAKAAEQKEREEQERKAAEDREKALAAAEKKAKEEQARLAKIAQDAKDKQEAEKRAKEEAERLAKATADLEQAEKSAMMAIGKTTADEIKEISQETEANKVMTKIIRDQTDHKEFGAADEVEEVRQQMKSAAFEAE